MNDSPAWFRAVRQAAAVAFQFEVVAIETGKLPTFSRLAKQHWWARPVLLAAIAIHLYWPDQR